MVRIDLVPPEDPVAWLESRLLALGLIAKTFSLKMRPGSIHWHTKKPGHSGTLEVTWWPETAQFWIEQRSGRVAPWQTEIIADMTRPC